MNHKDLINILNENKETSIIAYLDLSNMFHWQKILKWQFSVYRIIKQLLSIRQIKEVCIYYGLNKRDLKNQNVFIKD